MTLERHVVDSISMTLFTKEAVYGAGVTPWDPSSTCLMTDFDDASGHVTWDDVIQGNTDVITGREFPTHQELVRYSNTMTYTEPRVKPNTIVGLLGLAMGGKPLSTREGALVSYRHALTMGQATALPSIGVQVVHDQGQYRARYYGVKCSSLTLSNNGPYWQLAATLMGSGYRGSHDVPAGLVVHREPWMRWGDTRVWISPLTGGRLVVPSGPVQNAQSLSGGIVAPPYQGVSPAIELSAFLRSFSCTINNNFAAESGYRAGSGVYRRHLHAARREITTEFTFDIDHTQEVSSIYSYLQQWNVALEIDCTSTQPVDTNSYNRYGFSLIFPALRMTSVARGQEDQIETFTMGATAFDDGLNAPMYAWGYNRLGRYLA